MTDHARTAALDSALAHCAVRVVDLQSATNAVLMMVTRDGSVLAASTVGPVGVISRAAEQCVATTLHGEHLVSAGMPMIGIAPR